MILMKLKYISKALPLLTVLSALLFIPIGRVKAATNGSFSFSPGSTTLTATCEYEADIIVNTGGDNSNAADIEISFDPARLTIIDANSSISGIQAMGGNAYDGLIVNNINTSTGVIRIAGASFSGNLNGQATLASILFKSKTGVSSAGFTIKFISIGNSTDSNIAETSTSTDILGSVQNVTYTFTSGQCPTPPVEDNSNPQINIISPGEGDTDVDESQNIVIQISDTGSGIDLSSVVIMLNGEAYYPSDPDVTVTGDANQYTITFLPRNNYPISSASTLTVSVKDQSGNSSSAVISFNIPEDSGLITLPIEGDVGRIVDDIVNSPTTENIVRTINTVTNALPEPVQNIIQNEGLTSLSTVITTIGILANGLALFLALKSPRSLLLLFGFLFKKREKNPWGVVIDDTTNKPIAFANVRLFFEGSKALVAEKVSDLDGRYGFVASPDKYRLEVEHSDYDKFVTTIEIATSGSIIKDIRLVPKDAKKSISNILGLFFARVNEFMTKYISYFFVIGFFSSLVTTYINPTLYNIAITVAYIVLIVLQFVAKRLSIEDWGSVYDSKSNLLVPNALVKLFDRDSRKLIDTQMTDSKGRFGLFTDPGEYALLISARGYNFPSNKQKGLKPIKELYQSLLELDIKEGKPQEIDVYLDPIENIEQTVIKIDNKDSLQTLQHQKLSQPEKPTTQSTIESPFG
jgi:hypothetical protein